jgi:hypothetical protein
VAIVQILMSLISKVKPFTVVPPTSKLGLFNLPTVLLCFSQYTATVSLNSSNRLAFYSRDVTRFLCGTKWVYEHIRMNFGLRIFNETGYSNRQSWINVSLPSSSRPHPKKFSSSFFCNIQERFKHRLWIRAKTLWRWYISTTIIFLDIIHRPGFIKNKTFRRLDSVSVFR